jgi:predicted DCC family thiol-disulfide oxidoreductase YuxK
MKTSPIPMHAPDRLELFFDGECPLCLREVRMLKRLDRHARILFTDIAGPGFQPPTDVDYGTLMDRIHARRGGEWFEGVEVFRQLYSAVGLSPLVALSRAPGVKQLLDLGYRVFAKNRLRLTGRCNDGVCAVGEAA